MKQTTQIQKSITFSPQLYEQILAKAKHIGISFADYIKRLAFNDITEEPHNYPMVDEETNKRIGESLKDIKEGRYIEIDPSNEEELKKLVGLK